MKRDFFSHKQRTTNFTWVTTRPGWSTPADSVYWTFIQTRCWSDPASESVLTLNYLATIEFLLQKLYYSFLVFLNQIM